MKKLILLLCALACAACAKEYPFAVKEEDIVLCEVFRDGDYSVDLVCLGGLAYVRERVGDEPDVFVQYLENTEDGLCLVRCE